MSTPRPQLILVSRRPEERNLFEACCVKWGYDLHRPADSPGALEELLSRFPRAGVALDLDAPKGTLEALAGLRSSRHRMKTIGVSAAGPVRPPATSAGEALECAHHLRRCAMDDSIQPYSRLVRSVCEPEAFGPKGHFDADVPAYPITLTSSQHRGRAVEVLHGLVGRRCKPRQAAAVAQAVDELLMNAIFAAPQTADGKTLRASTPRHTEFPLGADEPVTLELRLAAGYAAVSVTDPFGSFRESTFGRAISRDFRDSEYIPSPERVNAGLGLRSILDKGVSLQIIVAETHGTEATVYFPIGTTYREFRQGFQFCSFIDLSETKPGG